MTLKTGSFLGMANDIKARDEKIIIFGTGVIGMTVVPEILKENGLIERVEGCIDNDSSRWNSDVIIGGKEVKIYDPDIIKTKSSRLVVLITISRFFSAFEQLKSLVGDKDISCYIIPIMCITNFHTNSSCGVIKTTDKPIIPKKIHYMWLGRKEMPDNLHRCIESWKKYCPDYEIIRWDESNYDVHKNRFVTQAYDNNRLGFVPDYARLELLYEHGGIYMDTDVEIQRNLDDLLFQNAFCSVEKWQVVNFGGCSGSVKGNISLLPYLENWQKRSLVREDGSLDSISSGLIDTSIALENGYKINGENQAAGGINIYTYDYFHPYDYMSGKLEMSNNTYSIHHFHGGWLDKKAQSDNQKSETIFQMILSQAENVDCPNSN